MSRSSLSLHLVSPYAMVRDRWRGTPYGQQVLPGERNGRGLSAGSRGHNGHCVRVRFEEILAEYRRYGDERDCPAMAAIYRRALAYAERLRDGAPDPGLRELGDWLTRNLAATPVAVWPVGHDWELPFTVGGGIVWPLSLCTDTPGAAQTFVHEMVHVAQGQMDRLPLFGKWMDTHIVQKFGYVRLDGIPVGRPACDWLNDYRTLNAAPSPHPAWWTNAIQNPDTLGIPYGVRLDGTLYLPWLATSARGMATWMLPLAWHPALGRHYISAQPDPLDGSLPGPHAALLDHFGGCHQFDHPHEVAAHRVVDFLLGKKIS
jgi:hypothetical protein